MSEPSRIFPAWPVASEDADFVPVGPWNTDGLIVFAPLRSESRSLYVQELRKQGHPVLFIATGEEGPSVSVDNETGIHQAVAHMAVDHGHRRIAFIAGDPSDQGDTVSRLRAFRSAAVEYGLDTDPRLIAYGWHTFTEAHNAVQKMIASGVKFTALVASNDNSAIGAMQAIQEAGLRIPQDIALIGFDDTPDAIAQIPPLASMHAPLNEMGQQALFIMLDRITELHQLESIRIPTRLVPRQSCGCLPDLVTAAAIGEARLRISANALYTKANDIDKIKRSLVEEMVATLPHTSRYPHGEQTHHLCVNLVDAFYASLVDGGSTRFQKILMQFLQELELADENINNWQGLISTLRNEMIRLPVEWGETRIKDLAEDMLHQARAAFSESAQRQDNRHKYQQQIATRSLGALAARLSSTLDERTAVEMLEDNLDEIGIKHARVALFESEGNDPVAWSVMLNSNLDAACQRFPSREFPPPTLYPPGELLNLALVPLVFQNESLGYVAFDAGNLEPCALIARQLAATFKTARLHEQVYQLSLIDPLTGVNNRRYFNLILGGELG